MPKERWLNAMARDTKNRQPAQAGATGKSGSANAASAPTKKRTSPLKFFSEVRQEGRKVTWTSRNEVVVSTIMVVILSAIAAVFFLGVDWVIGSIVNLLLSLGG